jgi:hypothetical protein
MLDFYTRFSWGNSRRIALVRILVSFGLRPGIHGEIFQKTLHALMKSPGNPHEIHKVDALRRYAKLLFFARSWWLHHLTTSSALRRPYHPDRQGRNASVGVI